MTVTASEPCSPYHGNLAKQTTLDWQQAADGKHLTYGVPQGCIVRNTFVEWVEYSFDSKGGNDENESPLRLEPARNIRRFRSCPGLFLVSEDASQAKPLIAEGSQAPVKPWSSGKPWSRQGCLREQQHEDSSCWQDQPDKAWRSSQNASGYSAGKGNGKGKGSKARGCENESSNIGGSGGKNLLILRGLPFQTTEEEVLSFVQEVGCKQWIAQVPSAVTLLSTPQGRPSGYAEIQLAPSADYHAVREKLHMQHFGHRYVEVMPSDRHSNKGSPPNKRADRNDWSRGERDRRDRDQDWSSRDWYRDGNQASWRRS